MQPQGPRPVVKPRFGITVRWSAGLAARLVSGMPATVVGQVALPAPLSRLLVLARSRSGQVSLAAAFIPTASRSALAVTPVGIVKQLGAIQPPRLVAQNFSSRWQAGSLFVLDEADLDRYMLSTGLVNQLVLCCGVWPVLLPLVGPRIGARPAPDREAVEAELSVFCELVTVTLQGIYTSEEESAGLPSVDLELVSTGPSMESAADALGRLGRSAASLLRPGGFNRGPGSVFEPETESGAETVSFEDVGGLEAAKSELQAICIAVQDPGRFRRWGARPPRGVLLYGPPGTGKTMLARALAYESGARFIHVRASDVVSKWYGEAEQKLQQAFDWARRERPAVIFFDEVDALARSRAEAHEATHRIVSTFLENMDGLRELDGVIVLAATNRPDAVDDALTRPGRFDRLVEVPLPAAAERRAIFKVHIARADRQASRSLFEPISEDDWEGLAGATKGFSGADVAEVVRRVLEARVRSDATEGQIRAEELIVAAGSVGRPW
jgi:AAA+ superfamily predicted ATPase